MQTAFQINQADNVATALQALLPGPVQLLGEYTQTQITCREEVLEGHKIALLTIDIGQPVIKYGVVIGVATKAIAKGTWVHLHCITSLYDERSSHLDIVTGAPKDIKYE
ncbi:UxaA family hydrolase [Ruminococcaceae bacterium OttesenSCG-928-A16]|nr:UxaA family hydrolase [Ruminococcaceae bacterium OttesenSCG-928-A16]